MISAAEARLIADGATEYASVGLVAARRLERPVEWATVHGDPMSGRAGDWALSDGVNVWTVRDDVFAVSYVASEVAGWFVKKSVTRLVRMELPFSVETLEGVASGEAGDFLAVGPAGDAWMVSAERRSVRYRPAHAEAVGQAAVLHEAAAVADSGLLDDPFDLFGAAVAPV